MASFGLLGPLQVLDDAGNAAELGGPKQRGVLALLALQPRLIVSSDTLIDGIWGNRLPRQASRTLSVYVSTLRRALEPTRSTGRHLGRIDTVAPGYRLNAADREVDAMQFEQLVSQGRAALEAGTPSEARDRLVEADALWRGPPLADLVALPFAEPVIHHLRLRRVDAHELSIEADLAIGNHGAILDELTELVQRYPLREKFWRQLMLALYRDGRQADSLLAFQRARSVLAEEAGLDPTPDLVELERRVLRQDPNLQVRPPRVRVVGIPRSLDEMIGRSDLLDDLATRIQTGTRLLTLLGPGGVGKTRVATELAHRLAQHFEDDVAFADLTHATDRPSMLLGIASALGIGGDGELDAQSLGSNLVGRRPLLVLDNVEQLVREAGDVAALISSAPDLTVLATSRTRLGIPGEAVVDVPPLALPTGGDDDEVRASPAVQLFLRRAREVLPSVDRGSTALQQVASVCRALDGLPLAIEMAAARVRVLSPEQMLDRLGTLTNESLAYSPGQDHHQSLRASLEWSLDLLSSRARAGFDQLAVFLGGFTLEAAEAVCGGSTADETVPAVEWLSELADASLLQTLEGARGPRFLMLQSMRARAVADTEDRLESEHAAYYLRLGDELNALMVDDPTSRAQAAFVEDRENWLGALTWAVGNDQSTAVGLIVTWRPLWATTPTLQRPVLDFVAELHASEDLSKTDRLRVNVLRGATLYGRGHIIDALPILEAGAPALEAAETTFMDLAVRGWCWLAAALVEGRRLDEAAAAASRARAVADGCRSLYLDAVAHDVSAFVAVRSHDTIGARAFADRALALDEARGDRVSQCFDLVRLGEVHVELDEADQADECARRLFEAIAEGQAPEWIELSALRLTLWVAIMRGRVADAVELLLSTLPRWLAADAGPEIAEDLHAVAATMAIAGLYDDGARVLGQIERLKHEHGMPTETVLAPIARQHERIRVQVGAERYATLQREGEAFPGSQGDLALRVLRELRDRSDPPATQSGRR